MRQIAFAATAATLSIAVVFLPVVFVRGIVGSFHKVSAKYLPLYVAEFQFRYNNRMNTDIFGAAISGC